MLYNSVTNKLLASDSLLLYDSVSVLLSGFKIKAIDIV